MKLIQKLGITTASFVLGFGSISLPSATQAAQIWNFKYSGSNTVPISASGTFTTTDLDPVSNTYTITEITGTRTVGGVVQQILSLLPALEFGSSDNLLYASEPFLTISGFSYKVEGDESVNLYSNYTLGLTGYSEQDSKARYATDFTFEASKVPEPLTLGGTAIAGAIGLWMKRKQKASTAL
ncbi:hypothetical protein A6770_33410 [Nostoc minutum NIES-26]|uniref:PEP-CTERM sorting domain-containing protein n=1 Tax=Nostoc minutum NIES-26 TaxID=1844469 RepID=A0A367Q2E2_9NOSO|nr:hypothetical protein A6770_33410 [Nostoc minutum NIES-26]